MRDGRGSRRGQEFHRELRSAELRFHFLDRVPAEYVLQNLIGLSISYERADRVVVESRSEAVYDFSGEDLDP